MNTKKAILIIMDGWGKGMIPTADAIAHANTPFIDSLDALYPHSELITCGEQVGLPGGQMGNSEVGHLNIGAGRIVYQELERINKAVRENLIASNPVLMDAINAAKKPGTTLHFIGLVSDGGVHSHIQHLKGLLGLAAANQVPKVMVHAFTDGRDTDPQSGLGHIMDIQEYCRLSGAQLATVCGRFYAMDRDKRWERVKIAYDALTRSEGHYASDITEAIKNSYDEDITDEFLKPIIGVDELGQPIGKIRPGDVVICFNFRTDRCREITEVLTQRSFPEQDMSPLDLYYVTMTEYSKDFQRVNVVFHNEDLQQTLGEVLQDCGKTQIRIAETEKYPHVSFFFSGGREEPFIGERRIMLESPRYVPTYDLAPEMSAYQITEKILPEIQSQSTDFICLNFANADMVGHTGVWDAAIKAAETVNDCVGRIVPEALKNGYAVFLTADHGNSDYLINEDGSPNTAHTLNPVPLWLISNDYHGLLKSGKLGDLAPTILSYMNLPIPPQMTGDILIQKN